MKIILSVYHPVRLLRFRFFHFSFNLSFPFSPFLYTFSLFFAKTANKKTSLLFKLLFYALISDHCSSFSSLSYLHHSHHISSNRSTRAFSNIHYLYSNIFLINRTTFAYTYSSLPTKQITQSC